MTPNYDPIKNEESDLSSKQDFKKVVPKRHDFLIRNLFFSRIIFSIMKTIVCNFCEKKVAINLREHVLSEDLHTTFNKDFEKIIIFVFTVEIKLPNKFSTLFFKSYKKAVKYPRKILWKSSFTPLQFMYNSHQWRKFFIQFQAREYYFKESFPS